MISLLIAVFFIACMWVIFEKANIAGWKAIVPLYNTFIIE